MKSRRVDRIRRRHPVRMFLLLFLIPALAIAVLGFLWLRGDLVIGELPEGTGFNLAAAGILVAALFLVATISLPLVHRLVVWTERRFAACLQGLRGARTAPEGHAPEGHAPEGHAPEGQDPSPRGPAEPGPGRLGSTLALPFLALVHLLAWPVRLVLILASLALVAATLVFAARLIEPSFLQDWVDRANTLLPERPA